MYCPLCKLDLRSCAEGPCPRCARPFDPLDADTTLPSLSLASRIHYAFLIPRCLGPPAGALPTPQWKQWTRFPRLERSPRSRRAARAAALLATAVVGGVASLSGVSSAEAAPILWLLAPSLACLAFAAAVRCGRPAIRRGP